MPRLYVNIQQMRKIIKIVLLAVLLQGVSNGIWARRVPLEKAERYARNWWLQKDGNRNAALSHVETEFENIYLFVDTNDRGFVMLAADDRSLPVLGYSLKNNFVVDIMPVHVHAWIQDYDDQIQWLIDNNIEKTNEINAQWRDLENERRQLPNVYPSGKTLSVNTKWDQGSPYNQQCPQIGDKNAPTGCVATAMAQIMKYHEWPPSGIDSHSYKWDSQTLSADFATTTYKWADMQNTYSSSSADDQKDAVATLMYHVGVAVDMIYGANSSSALTVTTWCDYPAAVNAYKRYFKYKWTATSVYIGNYTTDDWKLLMKNEIDNNRPVQYSGRSKNAGHSFVCHGYDTDELFLINWGWSGTDDGYFVIGALNTLLSGTAGNQELKYSLDNKAIIGIEPDRSQIGTTVSISASSNNTSWGTVALSKNGTVIPSGNENYTRFVDTVFIEPVAKPGCRFVEWRTGSTDVPLKFLASGEDTAITAIFERIQGDTLNYCRDAYDISLWLEEPPKTHFWGIKLPASCLAAGNFLTAVMLYAVQSGDYTVHVYEDDFNTKAVYSEAFNITKTGQWDTLRLDTILEIDASKDLCVAFEFYCNVDQYPCAISSSAANKDGSYAYYYGDDEYSPGWYDMSNCYDNDYYTWMIKAITVPPHQITMDASKVQLTSASKDVYLQGLGVSNKSAVVSYEIVSCSPENIATITDGCKITATGVGTVKIKAAATDPKFGIAENTIDLPVSRGTLVFDGHSGNSWTDAASWYPHYDRLPDAANFDANVNVPCTIPAETNVECNDLMINANGAVTVTSDAVLNVKGELTNDDSAKLLIRADEKGSGTVVYKSGSPKATVEMYLKGTSETDADGHIVNPQWQLRGCIVDDFALVNDNNQWANIHVYRWQESNNRNGCWTEKMEGSNIDLDPWWGYGFANYSTSPVTLQYTGMLKNGNCSFTLYKTGSGNANVGNNMLTNSYAAPYEISQLDFVNAKSSVIFYNTGSWLDWKQYEGDTTSAGVGTTAGQMLVCPQKTSAAAGLPTTIPSGQSFYVVAEEDKGSVTVYYSYIDDSNPSDPMFMPSEEKMERFNVLGITISGKNGGDRVVLIENENCDDGYNDGYDGMKYFGDAGLPQLFAVNDFGITSINAAKTMLGQKIGVTNQSAGEVLRMTFETDKLEGFAQLRVHDFVTGKFVNVLAGEEYEFVTTGNDKARFEVVGFTMQNADEEGDSEIRVYGNRLYVGENEGPVFMCDMSGKIVWQADVRKGEWMKLPELLHGVYVIKTDGSTIKIVK